MTTGDEWAGAVGDVWAAEWPRTDLSFADLSRSLDAAIQAAAPTGAGRAVDIGSGAGTTSLALADARPDLHITGLDLSPELVAVARERAGARDQLDFIVGDAAQGAAALAPIDLIFSRHGVMFFDDPTAAFKKFRMAAAPDGRLVFSCFRAADENAWVRELIGAIGDTPPPPGDAPGPFAFADSERVARILSDAGWRDAAPIPVDYVYHAAKGDDPVGEALAFFRRIGPAARALRGLPPGQYPAALARLTDVIKRRRDGDAIDFPGAAWIWSAHAS